VSRGEHAPKWRELAGRNVDHVDGAVLAKKVQYGRRQRTIGDDTLHEDLGTMLCKES
jgi:hypothetical protein